MAMIMTAYATSDGIRSSSTTKKCDRQGHDPEDRPEQKGARQSLRSDLLVRCDLDHQLEAEIEVGDEEDQGGEGERIGVRPVHLRTEMVGKDDGEKQRGRKADELDGTER